MLLHIVNQTNHVEMMIILSIECNILLLNAYTYVRQENSSALKQRRLSIC